MMMEHNPDGQVERTLRSVWLLQGLAEQDLRHLAVLAETRRYLSGETILRQGDASDGLYVVEIGSVRIVTHASNGDVLLSTVGPSDIFGEMGVIDGLPRSASAMAVSLCVLHFIPGDAFLDILEAVPNVALRLVTLLSDRLRRVNGLVAELPGSVSRFDPQLVD